MSKFKKILKKIAEQEGVSAEEVYHEMQIAIDIGFSSADPVVQVAWKNIPLSYGKPRPEDVIMYCVEKIKRRNVFHYIRLFFIFYLTE